MELLNISQKALNYYRKHVRGNEGITVDQAKRKLTRNVLLAKKLHPNCQEDINKGNVLYQYGNLLILVKDNCIIHLKNHYNVNSYRDWKLDRFKYVELSKEFGIEVV
ncbi:hypothetical protein JK635_02260 [Neobacillus sp. YIM B02564]|uniref:Uncharacterized protein n=1 Tax=Neobacillus paridis TaxID=2803862 RepID=A0ABS1TIR0_9BACI|nr:hypothetical protein [Neobacillus paridis]MBL4951063.1 hypothetical protein [Neobacillus paridis]